VKILSPVVSHQVLDPDALAAAIQNANFQPCQLSIGPSISRIARVICPTVCLDFASLGPAMLFSGFMPQNCYTLVFVTECERKGRSFNFAVEHHDGYMGFFPPGGVLDAYTPEGYANATLTVHASVFESAVDRLFPEIPESVLKHGAGMRIDVAKQIQLRSLLKTVMQGVEDSSGPLMDEAVRRQLEADLLDAFLSALRDGCESLLPKSSLRTGGRLKRLKQARDYLSEHLHTSLPITALCGELGMSKRGVELMFQDALGIGPNAFIRHQRLHRVRRALKTAPQVAGAVKEIALAWGFWHLGHFSQEYRKLFGESPSSTLYRNVPVASTKAIS